MQQGMLFHTLYAPQSGMYFEQLSCRITGSLDASAFRQAWECVLNRHTILRTSFVWKRLDRTLQVVHRRVPLPFVVEDWRDRPSSTRHTLLEDRLREERALGFDLAKAPLMRLALFQLGEEEWEFVWSHHHILLDGWSIPIIMKEVLATYEAVRGGQEPGLPSPRPFKEYIDWCQKQDTSKAESFWRDTLRGFSSPTPLVVNRLHVGDPEHSGEYRRDAIALSQELTSDLVTFARRQQVTINTLVQGAWALLLSRYSDSQDVVFGTTVSGRPPSLPDVESMVGLFINTIPFRVTIDPRQPIIDWVRSLQAQQAELRQYEYSPLVQVQGWSDVPRGTPLFHSILVFENFPFDQSLFAGTSSLRIDNISHFERTNYPLTLVAAQRSPIPIEIAYDSDAFEGDTIHRILEQLHTVLTGFVRNANNTVGSIDVLTDREEQKLLVEWNTTGQHFPEETLCVHEWFDLEASRDPSGCAITYNSEVLSKGELNRRANQVARYLRNCGVGPEVYVGLCITRSFEMVVGLLGILKAGGAYVPLDPAYPSKRLAFIIDDARLPIILTQEKLVGQLPENRARVICLDADWGAISAQRDDTPSSGVTPENLAYVVYTSGSTGHPKGVAIQHRGVTNLIWAQQKDWGIDATRKIMQFASLNFDASVSEIFLALVKGATLSIADLATVQSLPELERFLVENAIDVITLPPTVLSLLSAGNLPSLRTVIAAGESCPRDIALRWMPGRTLINAYGPTEGTVGAAWESIQSLRDDQGTIPIGRPAANVNVFVLDQSLRPVPVMVPGELFLAGVGVARGYLNRPDLTAERFLPNPFSAAPGARMYRTGDLVRYLPDSTLDFVGRVDHQVKIRGFRVELDEIEVVLTEHETVEEAAVISKGASLDSQRLVAYLVPRGSATPMGSDLYRFLKARLPDCMIPSAFIVLQALPLLPNGKTDRAALQQREEDAIGTRDVSPAPRTPTEELLAGIWCSILNVEGVGTSSNFFELGGHSLNATQLLSRIRDVFSLDLSLREVFERPLLSMLADFIDHMRLASERESTAAPLVPVSREGDLPLSYAQQRLWFLEQLVPGGVSYNIPAVLRLRGRLDVRALQESLQEVARRHEILRTTFRSVTGTPTLHIAAEITVVISVVDLSVNGRSTSDGEVLRMAREEVVRPFNLIEGPLFRALLIRAGEGDHVFVLTMHHCIADGWSVGVLSREVSLLYEAFSERKPSPLPPLRIQYADYAYWQRQQLEGYVADALAAYWRKQLSGIPPLLEIPTDRPRPVVQTSRGSTVTLLMPRDLLEAVGDMSREEGVTLFMTTLAAFFTFLYRYSGQEDLVVGSPVANRRHSDTEKLIGFFVNTLALRGRVHARMTIHELLLQIREVCLAAYDHQDLPFEKLVEQIQPVRDLSRSPVFQVAFMLQNVPIQPLELPGLSLAPVDIETGNAKYDLTLTLAENPDGLRADLEYNTDLFDTATARRMLDHYERILEEFAEDVEHSLAVLTLMSDEESTRLLVEWNETAASYPDHLCVHQWFEEEVQKHPHAIALEMGDTRQSYDELNRQANQIAHYLRRLNVGPEVLVGVCMERSPEIVAAVLGILKAGGAFVPIDPVYPVERIRYMIEDSALQILLTKQSLVERLPATGAIVINIDTQREVIGKESERDPVLFADPSNAAYAIYTSGSTGKPKGALLQHRGLCNLASAQKHAFGITPSCRILQFSSLSFDASVWEIVMALLGGATLILAPREELASGQGLLQMMREQRVTTVTIPPSVLAVVPDDPLPDLDTIITAGEKCPPDLATRWSRGRRFFNAYGPTETTVCATIMHVVGSWPLGPPIGRPITNTRVYLVDENMQPVPPGVPGELLVGGVSLARGYLGRPDATAEKFVPDPFGESPGARLYRTGDLARYLADGNIEYLGRIDTQVKVRGFRIELGEIEAVLASHALVREAVAVVREDIPGDKRVVAYVVVSDAAKVTTGELRSFLREHIPDYMIPSMIVFLDSFALTPSGKVDHHALPIPEHTRADLTQAYVPPRTDLERQLADISGSLLGIEKVGIHDNFFDLGGHSLLATQFIARVREKLHVDLPLRTLFETPSIASLGEQIMAQQDRQQGSIDTIMEALERVERLSPVEVAEMAGGKGTRT